MNVIEQDGDKEEYFRGKEDHISRIVGFYVLLLHVEPYKEASDHKY